jgi:hypothetical protein
MTWRRFQRAQASSTLAVKLFQVDCVVSLKPTYVFIAVEVGDH